ncbi:MAG TPA: glycoside hydrolase domain-containing protein, partial [Gemmatirosa sp.]
PWIVRHGVGQLEAVEQTAPGGAVAGAFDQDAGDHLQHTAGSVINVGGTPGQAQVAGRHLGFDTHTFPGVAALRAWKTSGVPYEWVGYYLASPCHRERSWSGHRAAIDSLGFGIAVIYVGEQTWGRVPHPGSRGAQTAGRRGVSCYADFVTGARGAADGDDAVRVTAAEGFARGTIIFLDVERMEQMPSAMRDYYRAWAARVLADGRYRPGVYVHAHNAPVVHDDLAAAYTAAGLHVEPPVWVASGRGFSPDKFPRDVGQAFAGVWQGVLDIVENHGGVRLPIDVNVASVPSPSAQYATENGAPGE